MDSGESSIHSFIVRLWLETPVGAAGEAQWRGRIVHVPSGASRYFDDLQEMLGFIRAYQMTTPPPGSPAAPAATALRAEPWWRRWWRGRG
ncbi:MAG: hypothetical protein HYR56_11910 [Acidobacteria bacterium]|nr:hypothetical protein [Acidobacteriota bacterium]MBI3428087.1 hypothetical protein [Acidobacteriota bacterium]